MSKKKHRKSNRQSGRATKNNQPVPSRSNRKLFIGAAVVAVLSVAGLIMAMVNQEPSPKPTNAQANSTTAQQTAPPPQFAVTASPPASSGSTQPTASPPQFTVTINPPAASPTPGTPAPDFTLQDLKGRPVQLSKLRGKVVVVNFWATWCGPCRAEIPGFVKVYEKYREKGLEIVGISMDYAGREVVEAFVKKNDMTYPVAIDLSQVPQQYGGVQGIPTSFIIDRQGRVAKKHIGYMDQTAFENMIEPLL
jgi:cytochrome c biogenesis protein CcmG/thiol:disulfide interchange protein DsbE